MIITPEYIDKVTIKSQDDLDKYCLEKFNLEYQIEMGIDVKKNQKRLDEVLVALTEVQALDDED